MVPDSTPATQLIDRFELLVGAVDAYAIFMLDPDGTVISWNRGAERIKGYSAEEVVGRPFAVFYTPDDLARGKPARELAIAAALGYHRDVGLQVRNDSSVFWADVLITAIKDADGRLIGYAEVTHDDTDRRNAEELTRQAHLMTERDRVARELQETVVRQIFRAALRLSAIANLISDPQITSRVLSSIADLDATLEEIRDVVTDCHGDQRSSRPHTKARLFPRRFATDGTTAASVATSGHRIVRRQAGRFTASS